MIAASMTQSFFLLPLMVGAWWWAPRDQGPAWALACGMGLVGTMWAVAGINAFAVYPGAPLAVGWCWAMAAATLAWMAQLIRLEAALREQRPLKEENPDQDDLIGAVPTKKLRRVS